MAKGEWHFPISSAPGLLILIFIAPNVHQLHRVVIPSDVEDADVFTGW
jgi:hypothetical protein